MFTLISVSHLACILLVSVWQPKSRNGRKNKTNNKTGETEENQLQKKTESQNPYFLYFCSPLDKMNKENQYTKSMRCLLLLVVLFFVFEFSFYLNHDYMCLHACIVFLIFIFIVSFLFFDSPRSFSLWFTFFYVCFDPVTCVFFLVFTWGFIDRRINRENTTFKMRAHQIPVLQ